MMHCLIVAAVVTCTAAPASAPPAPATAVAILTASVPPYVAPWPRAVRTAADERPLAPPSPSPFPTPATPIAPLAAPWRVTTTVTPWGAYTWVNGVLIR